MRCWYGIGRWMRMVRLWGHWGRGLRLLKGRVIVWCPFVNATARDAVGTRCHLAKRWVDSIIWTKIPLHFCLVFSKQVDTVGREPSPEAVLCDSPHMTCIHLLIRQIKSSHIVFSQYHHPLVLLFPYFNYFPFSTVTNAQIITCSCDAIRYTISISANAMGATRIKWLSGVLGVFGGGRVRKFQEMEPLISIILTG